MPEHDEDRWDCAWDFEDHEVRMENDSQYVRNVYDAMEDY